MYSYQLENGVMFRIYYKGRKTATYFASEHEAREFCAARN